MFSAGDMYVQYCGLLLWCLEYDMYNTCTIHTTLLPDSVTQQIGRGLGYRCPSTLFSVTVEPPKRKLPHTQLCPFPSPLPVTPQCWLCGPLCSYKAGWTWLPVIVTKLDFNWIKISLQFKILAIMQRSKFSFIWYRHYLQCDILYQK